PSTAGGVELLRIDFEIKYSKEERAANALSPDKKTSTTSGWFVVRPDDGWVIQEAMVSNALRENEPYTRVEYGDKVDGVLLPKEITMASAGGETVFYLDTIRFGSTPESEFSLTAFGLAEIDRTPKV